MTFLPKAVFGLLVAAGLATAGVAANAQPAQAAVFVAGGVGISFGGGYAPPRYHWYRWHDGYGWHRRWVAYGWSPQAPYARPVYFQSVPVVYGRPEGGYRDWHDRDWHRDHNWYDGGRNR